MGSGHSSIVPVSAAQSPDNINRFISSFSNEFLGQVSLLGADIYDVDASNIILLKKNRKISYRVWSGEDVFIGSIAMWDTKIQVLTFCVHMFYNYKFLIINLPMQIHQNVIEYIENQTQPIKRNELLEKIVFFYSNQNIYKNLLNSKNNAENIKSKEVPQNRKSNKRKKSAPKKSKRPNKIQIPTMIINNYLTTTESDRNETSSHSQKIQTISIGLKSPNLRRSRNISSNLNTTNTNPSSSASTKNNTNQSSNFHKIHSNSNIPRKNSVLESDFHMDSLDNKIHTPEIYKMSVNGQTDQQAGYYEEEEEENDYDNEGYTKNNENNLILSYEEDTSKQNNNNININNDQYKQRGIPINQYHPPSSQKKLNNDFIIRSNDNNPNIRKTMNSFTESTSATFSSQTTTNRYSYGTTNNATNSNRDISSENNISSSNRKSRDHSQNIKAREIKSPQSTHMNHVDHNHHPASSNRHRKNSQNDYYDYEDPNRNNSTKTRKNRHQSLSNQPTTKKDTHHHHHQRSSSSNNINGSPHQFYNKQNNVMNNNNNSSKNRSASSSGKRKVRVRKYPLQENPSSYKHRSKSQPRSSLRRIKYTKDANEFASNIAFFSSEEEDKRINQKKLQKVDDLYQKIGSNLRAEIAKENEEISSGSLSFFDLTNRQIKTFKNSEDEIDVQHVFPDYSSIDFTKDKKNNSKSGNDKTLKKSTEKVDNDLASNENKGFSSSSYIRSMIQKPLRKISDQSESGKENSKKSNRKVSNRKKSKKNNKVNNNESNSSSFFSDFKIEGKRTEEEKNKFWETVNLDSKEKSKSKFTQPQKETDLIDGANSSSTISSHKSSTKTKKNRAESVRRKNENMQKQQRSNSSQKVNTTKEKEKEVAPGNAEGNKRHKVRAESVHSHHSYRQTENKPNNFIERKKKIRNSNSNSESSSVKDNNKKGRRRKSNLNSSKNSAADASSNKNSFIEKQSDLLVSPDLNDDVDEVDEDLVNSKKKNRILVDVTYHKEIDFLDE